MKRLIFKWILLGVVCFLLFSRQSLAEQVDQISEGEYLSILLVADDGFESLQAENQIPITDILTIVVRAAEAQNISVQLQGSTNNNDRSALQYSTTNGDTEIDWSKMPRRGNESILSSSVNQLRNRLEPNEHTRLLIISGKVPEKKLDIKKNSKLSLATPTVLTQLVPFYAGVNLVDAYQSILDATLESEGIDDFGYAMYTAAQNDQSFPLRAKFTDGYFPENLLRDLLIEGIFDNGYSIESTSFGIPAGYVDGAMVLVKGRDLSNIQVKSPDGTVYRPDDVTSDVNAPQFQRLPLGEQQIMLISFKAALQEGVWYLENEDSWESADFFYSLSSDYSDRLQKAEIVDSAKLKESYEKGESVFTASQEVYTRSLFRLYPNLVLKVTDTFASEILEECEADENARERVTLHFTRSGEHQLIFRLMNDKEELCRRTISLTVTDHPITFVDQKPIQIYFDALGDDNYLDATIFFHDPDGDKIEVTREGTGVVVIEDNRLSLQLPENAEDGSEIVPLRATTDDAAARGSIEIQWKSLKKMIEKLDIDCQVIHEDESGGGFEKRQTVRIRGQIKQREEMTDAILEQLKGAKIRILDSSDTSIADGSFDAEDGAITSETFRLPDVSGEYSWTIQISSAENTIPSWKHKIQSAPIRIDNQPPILNSEKIPSESFGEEYLSDISEWQLKLPEDLFQDPDGDPIDTYVKINENEPVAIDPTGTPITMNDFGTYTIEIYALDNEKEQSEEKIKQTIGLFDKQKTIQGMEGTYSIEIEGRNGNYIPAAEKEVYYKRQQVRLVFEIKTEGWSEKKLETMKTWLTEQRSVVIQIEEDKQSDAMFDPNNMTLSAVITLPDTQKEVKYYFAMMDPNSGSVTKAFDANELSIINTNQKPVWNDSGIIEVIDEWIMKAETYDKLVFSDHIASDPDGDELTFMISLAKIGGDGLQKEILLPENTKIDLPYKVVFPAFETFSLKEKYNVHFVAQDSEKASIDFNVQVTLRNKTLLLIIIAAVVILLIVILSLCLYMKYRHDLPAFDGKIVFVFRDNEVSQQIELKPWKKEKHVLLTEFAGSINILLNDKQWEKMKQLELRPDKKNGYTLHNGKKKKTPPESLPYNIDDNLIIRDPRIENAGSSHM